MNLSYIIIPITLAFTPVTPAAGAPVYDTQCIWKKEFTRWASDECRNSSSSKGSAASRSAGSREGGGGPGNPGTGNPPDDVSSCKGKGGGNCGIGKGGGGGNGTGNEGNGKGPKKGPKPPKG